MCSYLLKKLNIILQEFQYGTNVFQTTTNKVFTLVNDSKVQRGVNCKS